MRDIYADRYQKIDALLDRALDVPVDQRRAFIEKACAADHALRDEVLRLVDLMDSSNGFLEAPPAALAAAVVRDIDGEPTEASRLSRVGPFRLVREIGRGGMGAVFLGERDDGQFEQRVAVKLIGRATSDVLLARFLEERRILAMLDHPGIAHLVDGGVTEYGTPWFAMEYVDGKPIDRYCDEHQLTLEQRISLFASVCDAVQYAHQHFVVHRDLKPSNILVTDDGQLKLLDFGIAKLLDPLLTREGETTMTAWRALTPEYAAPEQIRGLAVSAATDVYALGVLLYLLLAGQRPYDLRDRSATEVVRVICEIDPPKPSSVAAPRRRRALRGDIDVIVMQALRKDAARRYTSAAALHEDLDRLRRGLPIRARGDAAAYRFTKFVKRRAWPLAAAAAAMALLTGATVRERTLRSQAEEENRKAEQTTDFMFGLFEASENGQSLSDTITAKQLLEHGVEQARARGVDPEVRAQMLSVLGRLEMQIGSFGAARPLLTEALALRRKLYGQDHPDVANSLADLAEAMSRTGDTSSIALRREELAIRRRISSNEDVKTTDASFALAMDLHAAGNRRQGDSLLKDWQATISRLPPELTPTRLKQLNRLGEMTLVAGQPQQAESLAKSEVGLARQMYGDGNHQVAEALDNLALALDAERKFTEAEPIFRQAAEIMRAAYPEGNPQAAEALKLWGISLDRLSRNQEAEAPLRDALIMSRRALGDQAIAVITIEEELSYVLTMNGHYDEALSVGQAAADALTRQFGSKSAMVLRARVPVADALRGKGRFAEAEPMLLEAQARFQNSKGLLGAYWRSTAAALVRLYEAEGKPDEAAKYRQVGHAP